MQAKLNQRLESMLTAVELLPVVTIDRVEDALPLAAALQERGIHAIEITLRTAAAIEAIHSVRAACPDMLVAAGTVTTPEQMQQVSELGVDMVISPAMTETLIGASQQLGVPYLPGVATPSEVLRGGELGLEFFKLFPAVAVGGVALLKSMAAPMPQYRFCPTGGLNESNYKEFLALPNVICVGGSWMVPAL